LSFSELIRKNKEELLMNEKQLEEIEKRMDKKYSETLDQTRKNQEQA
jgi:Fur-regulated basic protein B